MPAFSIHGAFIVALMVTCSPHAAGTRTSFVGAKLASRRRSGSPRSPSRCPVLRRGRRRIMSPAVTLGRLPADRKLPGIVGQLKIKVSGRLSGKLCWREHAPGLRALACACVLAGEVPWPAVT